MTTAGVDYARTGHMELMIDRTRCSVKERIIKPRRRRCPIS